jgi:hypothetical protein
MFHYVENIGFFLSFSELWACPGEARERVAEAIRYWSVTFSRVLRVRESDEWAASRSWFW